MSEKKTIGRPTTYSKEWDEAICAYLMSGKSLNSFCNTPMMPQMGTVYRWLHAQPQFRENYMRAREVQAHVLFDQCLDIADDGTNDWVDKQLKKGGLTRVIDHEHVNRSRLRIDTRQYMAKMLAPRSYSDKLIDGDGDTPPPTPTKIEIVVKDGKVTACNNDND